ncbi:zinc finger protein 180-like isoform X1 [Cheilinus undulatus]|uniref:zinc finger protein 180-like isoform X1 n=1 Tax=Cheilinus undulatus TaxID=241271 RepID=UPI001BD5F991|nr:zinc finger protein 180-like isoform X1 [Cheilinus undulatus]
MYSEESLREFVTERLTAAAEDIFVVFKKTIIEYEEKIERQRKLLDIVWKPDINVYRIKLPQQPICKEDEGLVDPEGTFSPVLEEAEPPRIKEEPEEPCSIQEGERLILKEETDAFMLTPAYKESYHSEPQLKRGHMPFSYNSHVAENQSLEGSKHEDSEPNRNKDPNIIPQNSHNTDVSGVHFGPLQDQQSYKCDTCDKAFRSKSALRTHHRVHTGKETHSCKICGETFSWKSILTLHTRRHKDDRPFSCKICGNRFFNMSALRKHSLIHTGERPFKCDTCGKSCRSKSDLNVHMRTHTGERPYSCGMCGKSFNQISHYYSHIKIHTGEKPFSCKTCGKRFHRISHLKAHVWTHENRFMCKTCGQSCRDSHELKAHMGAHTGERPYSCDICGKSFIHMSLYHSHIKVHSDERLFTCETCGSSFMNCTKLKKHMKDVHEGGKL